MVFENPHKKTFWNPIPYFFCWVMVKVAVWPYSDVRVTVPVRCFFSVFLSIVKVTTPFPLPLGVPILIQDWLEESAHDERQDTSHDTEAPDFERSEVELFALIVQTKPSWVIVTTFRS